MLEEKLKQDFFDSIENIDDVKEQLWQNRKWQITQNNMIRDFKRAIRESVALFQQGDIERGIKRLYMGGIAEIYIPHDEYLEYEKTGKIKRYDETNVDYTSNLDEICADLAKDGIASRR